MSSWLAVIASIIVAIFGPGAVVLIAVQYARTHSYDIHFIVLLAAMVFLGAIYFGVVTTIGLLRE
jgi:hypothetical protein